MTKKMTIVAVAVTGVFSLLLGVSRYSILDGGIGSIIFMVSLGWIYPGLLFTLILQQPEGRQRNLAYGFVIAAFLIWMFGMVRDTMLVDVNGLVQLPQILFGIVCVAFVVRQLAFLPKSPPSTSSGKMTVTYGVSTSSRDAISTRLPSGEIRCGNCGIVNSPSSKYCRNCQRRLTT